MIFSCGLGFRVGTLPRQEAVGDGGAPWTCTRYLGAVPLLLERERELDRLGMRLDGARASEGGVVVVEGAPGLGKTSFLRAAVVEAQRRGFEVARARGAELEREWPFGIARQLLEPVLRRCSAEQRAQLLDGAAGLAAHVVLPEMAAEAAAVDASFGTLHGLYWLCANLATRQPLLLVVDDAQWADASSLRFLGVLARRVDALPALLLLAQRPAPANPLAQLASDPQTELLALRPLSSAAVGTLLAQWSPAGVDVEFSIACEAATGGNPFLLSRLVRGLHDQGIAFTAAHTREVTSAGADALSRLGRDAVALAEATAILGDDIGLPLAAELAQVDGDAADAAVEQLVRAAVLHDARPLRFVHAIVRDGVAARLSAGGLGSLHARAAELLAGRDAAPDAVAVHLLATEPRARPWVVDRLMAAARQALAQGAPQVALARLERALDEPPAAAAVRAELMLDRGRAESRLGRREALEHLRAAYELAPDPVLRAKVALEFTWSGSKILDVAELVALLEQAISELEDRDRDLTLELEAARLATRHIWAPMLASSWPAGDLQRWANLKGDTLAECLVLAQLSIGQIYAGGPAAVAAAFAERAARDPGLEVTERGGQSLLFVPYALCTTDRLDEAERVLERALRAARQRGSLVGFALVCAFRGAVALRRGALSAAEAEFRAGLDALPPDAWRRQGALIAGLLDVLVQTGDLPTAQALLDSSQRNAALPDDRASNSLLASRSRLRLAQGDPHRALADALQARRQRIRDGSIANITWDGWSLIVSLYHAFNELEQARREADTFLTAARRWDTPGAIGQALRTSGLIERGERGLTLLRDAVEHLERSPARLEQAYALVDYGAALRRSGDRAAAREPLRRGLDIAAAAGAHPLADRARQELTATGIRVRRVAQTGIASLTPSERRITELAVTGATNPEIAQALFITVKTVEMHLGHAYRKLDITSRHQLPEHLHATAPK
jgi:DNA-binding CsgD family transcriptional regulator